MSKTVKTRMGISIETADRLFLEVWFYTGVCASYQGLHSEKLDSSFSMNQQLPIILWLGVRVPV